MLKYLMRIVMAAFPASIVFCCFLPYRMKALKAMKLYSPLRREIGLVIYVSVIAGVLALTLWPTYYWENTAGIWGNLRILIDRPSLGYAVDLIPFSTFSAYINSALEHGAVYIFDMCIHTMGNIIMFMPIGFGAPLLFRNVTRKQVFLIGCGMSVFIELAQFFIVRNVAFDDVLLNTIGAVLGYCLYKICLKKKRALLEGFLCREREQEDTVLSNK